MKMYLVLCTSTNISLNFAHPTFPNDNYNRQCPNSSMFFIEKQLQKYEAFSYETFW